MVSPTRSILVQIIIKFLLYKIAVEVDTMGTEAIDRYLLCVLYGNKIEIV